MSNPGIPCTPGKPVLVTFTNGTQAIIVPLNNTVIGRVDVPADSRKPVRRWIVATVEE